MCQRKPSPFNIIFKEIFEKNSEHTKKIDKKFKVDKFYMKNFQFFKYFQGFLAFLNFSEDIWKFP